MKPRPSSCAWWRKGRDHIRGWLQPNLRVAAKQELPNLLHRTDRLRDRHLDAVDRPDVVGAPPDWKRYRAWRHRRTSVHADSPVRHLGRPSRGSGRQTETA